MYILLILIHSLFILVAHLFGYYVIEGVFLVLMLFFLLYFSPIFFFKHSKSNSVDVSELFTLNLSPQKSLIIPLVLTYVGIYILAFTFSTNIAQSLHTHIMIFLAIFAIILGYIFSFHWKHSVFFDMMSFHLVFSYITIFVLGIFYYFFPSETHWLGVIFTLVTIGFSIFFFQNDEKYRINIFYPFLLSCIFSIAIILIFFFPNISLAWVLGVIMIFMIALFEYSEKSSFFAPFFEPSRVFLLWSILGFIASLSLVLFFDFSAIYFLILGTIFLFSVHIRFSNLVTYSFGIWEIFLLYSFLFFSLLLVDSVFSSLVFIFFLPLLLIGNTFFWQEKQKYDFPIIHYSSIGFAAIFFAYALIFLKWEQSSFLFASFGSLLLALLFFLSYFRFYKK